MAYRQAVSHQCEKGALIILGKNLNYAKQPTHLPLLPRQGFMMDLPQHYKLARGEGR